MGWAGGGAGEGFDPARVIQQVRRVCLELGQVGDNVVAARKAHACHLWAVGGMDVKTSNQL